MKKTRAKKFKVRMFYHLQNLFWGVLSRDICPGVFCPDTVFNNDECVICEVHHQSR